MARLSRTSFVELRIRPNWRASSSSRPRLPGGLVRLSRCFCSCGRSARSGRSILGEENGIGCNLHELKRCSETVAGDAAKPPAEIHRCEKDDCHCDAACENARYLSK